MADERQVPLLALVIGCGYLGRALADFFVENGQKCLTADCAAGRGDYAVNLADRDSVANLAEALRKESLVPDCVCLCASTAGGAVDEYRRVYEAGARYVVEAFPDSRIVMCSSTSVYGVEDGRWVTEVHSCNPLKEKGAILLEAEKLIVSVGGVVARLAAIYGPDRCALLYRFIEENKVLGPEDRWVNYIHRDDAVSALALLATAPRVEGKRFNVSDTSPMQLGEIYGMLSDVLNVPLEGNDSWVSESRRGGSNQRVSCALLLSWGWSPLYPSFADGIYNVLEDTGMSSVDNY